jgi:ABC-type Mn2+/Zn2+ transport system permease subunit
MSIFFNDFLQYAFVQYALAAAVLAFASVGVVGSITVGRHSTYIYGTISHCILKKIIKKNTHLFDSVPG